MGRESSKHTGRGQLVNRLADQVGSRAAAIEILQKRGQMDGKGNLTAKGRQRDNMTAEERAKDRASKRSGRRSTDYKYNPKTNRATLR